MFELPYRSEALRELHAPEHLDEAVQVTSPVTWLALTILVVAVAGILAWGVFGTVSTRIRGDGLVAYQGAQYIDVVALSEGYLTHLSTRVGDQVAQGDAVARIENAASAPAGTVEVRAPVAGEIVGVLAGAGKFVRAGEALYQMTNRVSQLSATAFMTGNDAALIEPGMPALVSPSTINQREFGSMRGVVREVSRFRMSPEALLTIVGNAQLVEQVSRSGAPLLVGIDLIRDANGGFVWTTAHAPPVDVAPGMLARVDITIRRQAPVTLGIPALSRMLGTE